MKARKIPKCTHCGSPNKKEVHHEHCNTFVGDTFSHYESDPCNCIDSFSKEEINAWLQGLGFSKINNSMWKNGNITLQGGHSHSGESIYEKILSTKYGLRVWIDKKFHSLVTTKDQLENILNKKGDK